MSIDVLRIIPTAPEFVPKPSNQELAVLSAHERFPQADAVTAETNESIQFVDAGGNWEGVTCPSCDQDCEEFWGDLMDKAYDDSGGFSRLTVTMPCCGAIRSLNDLKYGWPVGFARFVLSVESPGEQIDYDSLDRLGQLLGHPVRAIWSRN